MTRRAPSIPSSVLAQGGLRIGLGAQLFTGAALCLVAAVILALGQDAPLEVLTGPKSLTDQVLAGQGLALVAMAVSYGAFRLGAGSEATARTVRSYARLDLRGLNPVWMSIAAAVGEEMLFRAALQPLLGVWLASLVFLVTHTPVYRFRFGHWDGPSLVQAAGIFGTSVALGFVFQHVGLLASMIVHAWIDIVGLCLVRSQIIRGQSRI
jgi:membrane protease YdiL (CAAX protease family)